MHEKIPIFGIIEEKNEKYLRFVISLIKHEIIVGEVFIDFDSIGTEDEAFIDKRYAL